MIAIIQKNKPAIQYNSYDNLSGKRARRHHGL